MNGNTSICKQKEIHNLVVTQKSYFEIAKETPYLALAGELCGVFRQDFGENRSRYNGTTLYIGI